MTPFGPIRAAATGDPLVLDDCDELARWYRDAALPEVTAWGLSTGWYGGDWGVLAETRSWPSRRNPRRPTPATLPSATRSHGDQRPGSRCRRARRRQGHGRLRRHGSACHRLIVTDVSGEPTEVGRLTLDADYGDYELLVVGDRVLVLGTGYDALAYPADVRLDYRLAGPAGPPSASVTTVDLSDPTNPQTVHRQAFTGEITTAREHDGSVRLGP